jgi:hypothetical protein
VKEKTSKVGDGKLLLGWEKSKKNMVRNVAMIWKPHFEQVKFDGGFGHQKMMTGVRIPARHAHQKMSSFGGSGPSLTSVLP